jgi:predicted HicB family RNase H-like nuclease
MRFKNIPEVEPDAEDLATLKKIAKRNDKTAVPLGEIEYNGKISLRVPKTLHKELIAGAKQEGISLNQFIVYKLAK